MEHSPLNQNLDLAEISLLNAKISHSNNDAEKLRVDSSSLLYHAFKLDKLYGLRYMYAQALNRVNNEMGMYGRTQQLCELGNQYCSAILSCQDEINKYESTISHEVSSILSKLFYKM